MPSSDSTTPSLRATPSERVVQGAGAAILVGAIAYFLWNCHVWRDFAIDDAYITYRFGWRLAHDGALRWNLLTPPLLAYTTLMGVLVSALFEKLGLDPLTAWKVLSVLLALAGTAAAIWGARVFCAALLPRANRYGLPLFVGAMYCASPTGAIHATSGMETTLYATLLIALTAFAFHVALNPGARAARLDLLAFGFFLLALTRPESLLWSAIVAATVWIALPCGGKTRFVLSLALFFILPCLLYLLACRLYYGNIVPTVFYVKSASAAKGGQGMLLTYLPSHHEVWRYFRDHWLLFAAAALCAAVAQIVPPAGRRGRLSGRDRAGLLCAAGLFAASAACIAYFASVHMLMGYEHRFLFPYAQAFPLTLALPAVVAILRVFLQGGERAEAGAAPGDAAVATGPVSTPRAPGRLRVFAAGCAAGFLIFALLRAAAGVYEGTAKALPLLAGNNRNQDGYTRVGQALNEVAARAGRQMTLYHHNMGEMMYFAPRWDSIDTVGFFDYELARHGFSVDAVFRHDPELLILPSMSKSGVTLYPAELAPDISLNVYRDPRARRFEYLGYFPDLVFGADGRMHFFARRDLLARHPWIAPFLTKRLNLRMPPGNQRTG